MGVTGGCYEDDKDTSISIKRGGGVIFCHSTCSHEVHINLDLH
jgi:hypothetical protein